MTQEQVITNTVVQGTPSAYMNDERIKRQTESTADFWSLFTFFTLSTPATVFASLGMTGPSLDYGVVHITTLNMGSVAAFGGMYLAHKYQSQALERFARAKWSEFIRVGRVLAKWRADYEAKEQAEQKKRRKTFQTVRCELLFGQ
jgi:hypothetical protein